ncbi:MAG: hypothetical protein HC895_21895 [Leptolyngbyaceae cyanobacterium SM1_3_5]|nr:hypothetical protein [Leptolyngbyaceae cyanobacterium SM1_3_5]
MRTRSIPILLFCALLLAGCNGAAVSQSVPAADDPNVITSEGSGSGQRLTMRLTLSAPEDLKVREGESVQQGQIISDRIRDRQRLTAQQRKIQLQIQQLQTPTAAPPPARSIPEVAGLPPASFLDEVATVERQRVMIQQQERAQQQQQRMLDMLTSLPSDDLPEATIPHETQVLAQRQQELDQANADLQLAEAQLSQAQAERSHQEYLHSLEMSKRAIAIEQGRLQRAEQLQNQQEQEQQRLFQIAQLEGQLSTIETQLFQLSAVRSPYSGTIGRIKFEGQADQALTVELTLVVSGSSQGAN